MKLAEKSIFIKLEIHILGYSNYKTQFLLGSSKNHRIGLWENLQESPIFDGKNHGFL